jgi:hypothetical protein
MEVVSNHNRSQTVKTCSDFRFIRKQEIFKKIEQKKYIIWVDCGKHFR